MKSYAFDEEGKVAAALFDPAGRMAPDIAGRNLGGKLGTDAFTRAVIDGFEAQRSGAAC